MREKVLVAMSGGVDSSVAAALLKEQGYEVIGVTMEIWPMDAPLPAGETGCCSLAAVEDARRVAFKLDIPYYVLNFREIFADQVIQYFVDTYVAGQTPNPCIACNQKVKFAALLPKALSLGASYVATGHYARIFFDHDLGRYLMARAADYKKDQTYVLYGFTQPQLARVLLPLGGYTKTEVRKIAADLGLPTAAKAESQEICFVTDNDYRRFIREKAGARVKPGPVVDLEGNLVGRHEGIADYTIGQRRGLGLALGYPAYVVAIDPATNAVVVGPRQATRRRGLVARDNNFILFDALTGPLRVTAKIRYQAREVDGILYPWRDGSVRLDFDEPQPAITPGQAVVYYREDLVVGGGTIASLV